MALKVGDVYVAVTAAIGDFSKSMAKVAKIAEDTAKQVKEAAQGVADVGLLFAAGIAGAVAAATETNAKMKGQLDKLKSLFMTLAGDIGDIFAPVVERLVEAMSRVVGWFQSLSPELKQQVADYALLAAEVGLAALAIAKVAGLVENLAKGFGAVAKLIGVAGAPILLTVAAVAGLIAISALLWKAWKQNWGNIQEKTKSVLTWLGEKFALLGSVFGKIMGSIVGQWTRMLQFILQKSGPVFKLLGIDISGALDFAKDLHDWGQQIFTPEGMRSLFEDAKKTGEVISEGIAYGLKETGAAVKEAVQDIMKAAGLEGMFEGGGPAKIRGGEGIGKDVERLGSGGSKGKGNKGLAGVDTALRDAGASLAAQMRTGVEVIGKAFLAGSGLFGQTVQAFMQGGPVAAAATLLMASQQFQEAMAMVDGLFQVLADNLGRVFVAVAPLIGAVSTILLPVFDLLGDIAESLGVALAPLLPPLVAIGTLFEAAAPLLAMLATAFLFIINPLNALAGPILKALFEALKVVGGVVLEIAIAIGNVWNGMLGAIQGVLRGISDTLAALGIGSFRGFIQSLDQFKAPVDDMTEALVELHSLTWEQAEATAAETAATLRQTKAINDATESLTNVPSWWKVASARFGAADPIGGALAPAAVGPVAGATQGAPAAPTAPVFQIEHMTVVSDPGEFVDSMEEEARKYKRRQQGAPLQASPQAVPA